MFGLGLHPAFLIVLFIIVLIVFGPGKLPEMAGAAGRALREFRKASDDVTGEIRRALDLPEGQANLFSAQGLIDQLTREPETSTATEVAVPFEDETETDGTRAEGTVEMEGTEGTDPGTAGGLAKIGSFGPTEIDAGVFASSNDGSPIEGDPFEEAMAAGHHEPSSPVTAPAEEFDAVDQELAKPPDPVDEVEEAHDAALGEPEAADEEPAAQAADAGRPSSPAPVEEPPGARAEARPESQGDGGDKAGEGAA